MAHLLLSAELIISRSGYSTLMDFMALGIKNVELHPTPGQAEQVYLLERWKLLND
jgi:UDP-N-acetylglucosamine:LPS N-acetylglucosamine transferase